MSIVAIVENDTIKLPPGVHLPDGTTVSIEPREKALTAESRTPTLYESLREHIGCIDTGLSDLADQHDHYLYGTPKR